jgi:hypothetical protein
VFYPWRRFDNGFFAHSVKKYPGQVRGGHFVKTWSLLNWWPDVSITICGIPVRWLIHL